MVKTSDICNWADNDTRALWERRERLLGALMPDEERKVLKEKREREKEKRDKKIKEELAEEDRQEVKARSGGFYGKPF